MERYEDKDICKKCGGICCKKSGCDYFVSDFESMKIDYLENILASGYVSIIASLTFKRASNGKIYAEPLLSLRARNKNRDIIDLLSMKTTCLSLGENGCRYNIKDRPSGGAVLIPKPNLECYSEVDKLEELKKWQPHQKTLQRLVKRHTGMSVYEKLREDVTSLFLDILNENFEGISPMELVDIKGMLPHLIKAYPEEFQKALKGKTRKLTP